MQDNTNGCGGCSITTSEARNWAQTLKSESKTKHQTQRALDVCAIDGLRHFALLFVDRACFSVVDNHTSTAIVKCVAALECVVLMHLLFCFACTVISFWFSTMCPTSGTNCGRGCLRSCSSTQRWRRRQRGDPDSATDSTVSATGRWYGRGGGGGGGERIIVRGVREPEVE